MNAQRVYRTLDGGGTMTTWTDRITIGTALYKIETAHFQIVPAGTAQPERGKGRTWIFRDGMVTRVRAVRNQDADEMLAAHARVVDLMMDGVLPWTVEKGWREDARQMVEDLWLTSHMTRIGHVTALNLLPAKEDVEQATVPFLFMAYRAVQWSIEHVERDESPRALAMLRSALREVTDAHAVLGIALPPAITPKTTTTGGEDDGTF